MTLQQTNKYQASVKEIRELAEQAPVELRLGGAQRKRQREIAEAIGPDGVDALHRIFLAYNRPLADGFTVVMLAGKTQDSADELHVLPFRLPTGH